MTNLFKSNLHAVTEGKLWSIQMFVNNAVSMCSTDAQRCSGDDSGAKGHVWITSAIMDMSKCKKMQICHWAFNWLLHGLIC